MSSKGQVVLPKSLRMAHHCKPGTEFIIEDRADSIVLRPRRQHSKIAWDDMIGCVNYKGPCKTLRQTHEGVMAEALRYR